MPDTRPGVTIENGLCNACRHKLYKDTVDWSLRKKEFEKLCDTYQSKTNQYDCIVVVSSGKDSFWQVGKLREYNMNPLLVSVDNLDWTKTGKENFNILLDVHGVDAVVHRSSRELNRKMARIGFEHDGFCAWLFDRLIYTYPLHIAIKHQIPLIFYGENVALEYGGYNAKETPSSINQINNDVVRDYGWNLWTQNGIDMRQLNMAQFPLKEDIAASKLNPQYISYYFNWSGYEHMQYAKKHGWKSLDDTGEWKRQGYIEDYDQIDDFGYLVDPWMKYPKYGHARATDVASYWIRDGLITREEGIKLVKKHDHKLDPVALEHFLSFTGYSTEEFWNIVEKFWNQDIFEKVDGYYKLKNPIYK